MTLEEAISQIPPSYAVRLSREENDGGWLLFAERNQNGGTFRIITKTYPTWQEAFAELWSKL